MDACLRCRLEKELEAHARLVAQGVAELREGLTRELDVDERLELVAEEHELEILLERIERRRFSLTH